MNKLGRSLLSLIYKKQTVFPIKTVLQVGIQLIKIIQNLHYEKLGFAHLDIKPDNILLKSDDFKSCESSLLVLIDFSVSKPFLDEEGFHLENVESKEFNGNISFASIYQMKNQGPSRRDDLLSVLYLLIYLSEGDLPWTRNPRVMTLEQNFERTLMLKEKFHRSIAQQNNQGVFRNLIKYVDSLEFKEKPDYAMCIQKLMTFLQKRKENLDWIMEWNQSESEMWKQSFEKKKNLFKNFNVKQNDLIRTHSTMADGDRFKRFTQNRTLVDESKISSMSIQSCLRPIKTKIDSNHKNIIDESSKNLIKSNNQGFQDTSGGGEQISRQRFLSGDIEKGIRKSSLGVIDAESFYKQKQNLVSPMMICKIQEDFKEEESDSMSNRKYNQALKIRFRPEIQNKEIILQPPPNQIRKRKDRSEDTPVFGAQISQKEKKPSLLHQQNVRIGPNPFEPNFICNGIPEQLDEEVSKFSIYRRVNQDESEFLDTDIIEDSDFSAKKLIEQYVYNNQTNYKNNNLRCINFRFAQ